MKQQTPFFITITSEVLRDKDLNPIEKLIFTEIMALTYSCGYCYASNSHFADIFDRAVETISRNISKLQSKGYIYSEISQSDGNARKIFVKYTGQPFPRKHQDTIDENVNTSCQKHQDTIDENVKHSNTTSKSISKSLNKNTASGSSFNENSTISKIENVQANYQGNLDNSTGKENLQVEAVKTSKAELQKQDEIENFVNEHNSFNENEVALITEYIIDRKTIYKSKVKNTKQALNGLLCDIAEVKKQIPLEWVFQKDGDIYSNCGTAGDKTKPFQTIKIDYFKNVLQQAKQKATHNRMITPQKIDIDLSEMEQFNFTTL
jgi:hypothetical protein